jgi:hypothetical protein
MKILKVFILLFVSLQAGATNKYYSRSGSDANPGTEVLPKYSTASMDTFINTSNIGDTIFLKYGDFWDGFTFNWGNKKIVFAAYGNPVDGLPILTGSIQMSMTNAGGNIYYDYEAQLPTFTGNIRRLGCVTENWEYRWMSKYPSGDNYYQVTSGTSSSLTDNTKSWGTDYWANGIVVNNSVGEGNWDWGCDIVKNNNAITLYYNGLTFGSSSPSSGKPRYYAIYNHYNALTEQTWACYNDYLYYYTSGTPGSIRASVVEDLITIDGGTVSFINIDINSANYTLIHTDGDATVSFDGCRIWGSGCYGILNEGGDLSVENCEIAYCMSVPIHNFYSTGDNTYIEHNLFHHNIYKSEPSNIVIYGGGPDIPGQHHGICIMHRGVQGNFYERYNAFLDNRAAVNFHYSQSSTRYYFEKNLIDRYGWVGDLAGIYSNNDLSNVNKYIKKNFVLNEQVRPFVPSLSNTTSLDYAHGIYNDEGSYYFTIDSNTFVNTSTVWYMNGSSYVAFRYNNAIYGNQYIDQQAWNNLIHNDSIYWGASGSPPVPTATGRTVTNNTITYNTIFMDQLNTQAFMYHGYKKGLPTSYTFDQNKYVWTTASEDDLYHLWGTYGWYVDDYWTLAEMKSGGGTYEDNSTVQTITADTAIMLMNYSANSHQFNLSGTYKDANNTTITGPVIIPAFYSKPLAYLSGGLDGEEITTYVDSSLVPFLGGYTPPPGPGDTCLYHIYDTTYIGQNDSILFLFENNLNATYGDMFTLVNHGGAYNEGFACQGTYDFTGNPGGGYATSGIVDIGDSCIITFCGYFPTTNTIIANKSDGPGESGFQIKSGYDYITLITENVSADRDSCVSNEVNMAGALHTFEFIISRTYGIAEIWVDGEDETSANNTIRTDFNTNASLGILADPYGGDRSYAWIDTLKIKVTGLEEVVTDSCVMAYSTNKKAVYCTRTGSAVEQDVFNRRSGEAIKQDVYGRIEE